MVSFGQKEISNLVTYYQKNNYVSEEEKEKAISEWPLLKRSVKLQVKQRKNLFEIYTDLLREGREDMKNILAILNIMLVVSASTAAAECGFLKLNIEKTSLRTRHNSKTLSNIMRIDVDNMPMTKSDSRLVLKLWLKTGKRHIRGHKTKSKEDLTELTASAEDFFIHLTSQNSRILIYTLLSKIFVAKNFYCSSLISDIKGCCVR